MQKSNHFQYGENSILVIHSKFLCKFSAISIINDGVRQKLRKKSFNPPKNANSCPRMKFGKELSKTIILNWLSDFLLTMNHFYFIKSNLILSQLLLFEPRSPSCGISVKYSTAQKVNEGSCRMNRSQRWKVTFSFYC